MTVSQRLAEFIGQFSYENLPQEVVDIAVSCVYNYIGCVYSGSAQPPPLAMMRMLENYFPVGGKCAIIGTGRKADPVTAALINGTSSNAMAFDDMFKDGIHHPGASAITSAFAIAGLVPVSGKEMIAAIVLGYEISNRIAKACNPSHYRFWHTAATAGSFGSAVTAAKLLKLSEEQTVWAIGSAGTQATGLQECTGNMAQRFHLGTASRNGVLGALLAKSGFDGPPRILDGDKGFFKAMSQYEGDLMALFDDLGKKYTILDTTFKFYPCCGHIHACIDGVIINMQKNGITPEQVKRVEVATYQTALDNSGNPTPKDIAEAKFSIAYCIAAGILNGQVTVQEFSAWPPSLETLQMMERVSLSVDPEVEAAFPEQRGAKVTIHTEKGAFVEVRHSRKGDPDCPLTREDIVQKYRALTSMVLSREEVARLEGLIANLTGLQDVSVLTMSI